MRGGYCSGTIRTTKPEEQGRSLCWYGRWLDNLYEQFQWCYSSRPILPTSSTLETGKHSSHRSGPPKLWHWERVKSLYIIPDNRGNSTDCSLSSPAKMVISRISLYLLQWPFKPLCLYRRLRACRYCVRTRLRRNFKRPQSICRWKIDSSRYLATTRWEVKCCGIQPGQNEFSAYGFCTESVLQAATEVALQKPFYDSLRGEYRDTPQEVHLWTPVNMVGESILGDAFPFTCPFKFWNFQSGEFVQDSCDCSKRCKKK